MVVNPGGRRMRVSRITFLFPLMRSVLCQSLVAAVYLWILSPYRPYRVGDGLSTLVMDGW